MRRKKAAILVLAVLALCAVGYAVVGNPAVAFHNRQVNAALAAVEDGQTVTLNETIPFEWDRVYAIGPYTGREEIAEIIGFDSPDIQENNVSEGMVNLLFVRDGKVMASILGYGETLGYRIEFPTVVTFEEKTPFLASKEDDVVTLNCAA
ncbi:hypothetical protein [Oscillibacter sp. GMB15532]|uniref:hypothetical protein n=1 Tax=Oscillibacter sp. GMB15532 TaxID=3230022 RepID=UPI0034DF714E